MKKYIIIAMLFLIFPFVVEAAEIPAWNNGFSKCFELMGSSIQPEEPGVGKVEIQSASDLVFVQDGTYLLNKLFDSGKKVYLDYKVQKLSGADESVLEKIEYLNDDNLATYLEFDVYSTEPREVIVDLGSQQKANSLLFRILYNGGDTAQYYISQDGLSYVEVKDPEDFSFRYLKIIFKNNNENFNTNLYIQELNFTKRAKNTYLVNFNSVAPVNVYAKYQCEDNAISYVTNEIAKASRDFTFSINSNTLVYELIFNNNPAYDDDFDNDGHLNNQDNCPYDANLDQADSDGDLLGDACDLVGDVKNFNDKDSDLDKVADSIDNCPRVYNPRQIDSNADKRGDACSDDDNDGVIGYKDNCINVANPNQADINVNGIGDACEFDKDKDGVFDTIDNCITTPNVDQADDDRDFIGNACDNCDLYNPRQIDKNKDGKGDVCEQDEKYKEENDEDQDTILDHLDNCPKMPNKDQKDEDKDGIGDRCDNCLGLQNTMQADKNENGIGDKCEDTDNDGIMSYVDNCPEHSNADQADKDNDGVGDVCEDDDRDGIPAVDDNCEFKRNKDQSDVDKDGIGDVCDDKDDRFIESNKGIFIGFIVLITLVFGILIILMVRKIGVEEDSDNDKSEGENSEKTQQEVESDDNQKIRN